MCFKIAICEDVLKDCLYYDGILRSAHMQCDFPVCVHVKLTDISPLPPIPVRHDELKEV